MMRIIQREFGFVKPENEGGSSPHNQLVFSVERPLAAASNGFSPRQWGCRLGNARRELKCTHELNLCRRVINLGSAAPEKSGPLSWTAMIVSARARVSRVCAPLAVQVKLVKQAMEDNVDDTRFAKG